MLSLVVMLISRGRKELRLLMLAFLNVFSGVICQHEGQVVVLFHHGSIKRTGYHVGGRVFVQSYQSFSVAHEAKNAQFPGMRKTLSMHPSGPRLCSSVSESTLNYCSDYMII